MGKMAIAKNEQNPCIQNKINTNTIQFTLHLLASADAGMVLSAHVGLRN